MRHFPHCTVFAIGVLLSASPSVIAQTFSTTGNMSIARFRHTSTMLDNGKVLVVAGQDSNSAEAELYDPATGAFTGTGNLNTARYYHTATLLNSGMVLVVGGYGGTTGQLTSAELYNPATGSFSPTGNLNTGRFLHTATLLNNGKVLISGGATLVCGFGCDWAPLSSAELYDPATGAFTPTGNLSTTRYGHTATLLNNGTVLVAGGSVAGGVNVTSSAELYNPATGSFAVTGSLKTARGWHTATLLNNGTVLVAAGSGSTIFSSAELYNPTTGAFTLTGSLNTARVNHTATLLNNGSVLIAGGDSTNGVPLSSAELFDSTHGTFTLTGSLNTGRYAQTATLLNNGLALVMGGIGPPLVCGFSCSYSLLSSAELYHPATLTPPGLLSIMLNLTNPWIPIGNAMSFTATGNFNSGGPQILQSVTWSSSSTTVATITNDSGDSSTNTSTNRGNAYGLASGTTTITACAGSICGSTALTVAPHTNLLIGSSSGDSSSSTYESYNDTGAMLRNGTLSVPRSSHTATLLQNGTLFVAGGVQAPGEWQILDINGNVLNSGSLLNGFYGHFAVLLGNGNVFLGGGTIAPGTWEIRSPAGALVSSGSLLGQRSPGAGAVLLQNGNVWIFGSSAGLPGDVDSSSWEIRRPDGSLVSNGTLATTFSSRQVFTLSNGDIIFLGGVQTAGQYDIYTQATTLVRSGTLKDGFDGNAGGAPVGNNVFLFEHGYWEYLGFDANANTSFDTVGSLFDQRQSSGVVVTSAGKIFITGGDISPATWEMYTPNGTAVTLFKQGGLFDTRGGGHTLTHF